jgi:hypothetical protein
MDGCETPPALRANSRETVEGERPSRRATHRTDSPAARPSAISSRSETTDTGPADHDPDGDAPHPTPRSTGDPEPDRTQPTPRRQWMNSPGCPAAQNGCTTSEIMRLLNTIANTSISECCDDRMNRSMDQRTREPAYQATEIRPDLVSRRSSAPSPYEATSLVIIVEDRGARAARRRP